MPNGWKTFLPGGISSLAWEKAGGGICRLARWRRARCKHTLVSDATSSTLLCIAHLVCCKIWAIWTNALAPRRTQTHLKCIHHQQHSQRKAGSTALNELSQWPYTACALASFPVLPGVTVEFYLPSHTQKKQEKTEIFQLRERVKTTAPLKTSAIKQILLADRNFSEKRTQEKCPLGHGRVLGVYEWYWTPQSAYPVLVGEGGRRGESDTLAGGGGFLPKGSEDPNGSFLSVFLKKSSDEVPLKGSFSLNGSPPNGSRKKERNASKDSGSKDILLARPPQYEKTTLLRSQ